MNIAFKRVGLLSQASGHCLELMPIKLVLTPEDPTKELERMLSQLMLSVACSATGTTSPYQVEHNLEGDNFCPDQRSKVWERISLGHLRLKRVISKNAPATIRQLQLLRKITKKGDELLQMPLWDILRVADFSLWELEPIIHQINKIDQFVIPAPPIATIKDAARYSDKFKIHLDISEATGFWVLQAALFCLRRAEIIGHLPQYVLTYEVLFNAYLHIWRGNVLLRDTWLFVLGHLSRWYSRIELTPPNGTTINDVAEYLNHFGREFHLSLRDGERGRSVLRERWDASAVEIGQYPCVPVCA